MSKRPAAGQSEPGQNKKKKSHLLDSKQILAQNTDPALKDGALNVPKFIQSRQNEIQHLERAVLKAKYSSKQRAFQTLPRILRRRTASHNVKRVPKRVREKAKHEMAEDNTPTHTSAHRKKNIRRGYLKAVAMAEERKLQREGKSPAAMSADIVGINEPAARPKGRVKFADRQRTKVWLPTHVWQVKRAHMAMKWGYSVAVEPHEKAFRATHRVSTGSVTATRTTSCNTMAWDTSYIGTMLLFCIDEDTARTVVQRISSLSSSAHVPKYTAGKRAWEGQLYSPADKSLLGPGLIYYCPRPRSGDAEDAGPWRVMVRAHPSFFDRLHAELLQLRRPDLSFDIHDCRYAIGSIDLLGPNSIQCLLGALNPVTEQQQQQKNGKKPPHDPVYDCWRSLCRLSNAQALSNGIAISMDVHDPRLFFPPEKTPSSRRSTMANIQSLLSSNFPPEYMYNRPSGLFDASVRQQSYAKQATLKTLHKRKSSENQQPGHHITPDLDTDPRIPVLVIRRSNPEYMTVIAPWGWILPFWLSITHYPAVRVGGLVQQHQICFERQLPFFPNDFPHTAAGQAYNEDIQESNRDLWNRKPPAKRVAYDKIDLGPNNKPGELGSPFGCGWTSLLGDNLAHLVTVRFVYLGRGHAHQNARVYRVPESEEKRWLATVRSKSASSQNDDDEDVANDNATMYCPSANYLIGFMTTGDFNMSSGRSTGIGSIVIDKSKTDGLCLIRNVGSTSTYLATWTKI